VLKENNGGLPEQDNLMKDLKNKLKQETQENAKLNNEMSKKDTMINQLKEKLQIPDCQRTNSEMAKSALETKIKDIERDLKKETHEANQISAKLEQDLFKEKEIHQKLQQSLKNEIDGLKIEISEKSANSEMAKTALETKLKDVEYNLKKEAEEAKKSALN
jgi:ribosomal protein S3